MSLVIRTLSEQLVDLVRDRILTGLVAPDRPIRQDALAAELGVSKIPLREALGRLEQEGLIVSQANRGFTVRPLNGPEAEEVYALRLTLEPELTALAARRASGAEQQAAQAMFAQLGDGGHLPAERGQGGQHSKGGQGGLNRAFHLALLRPADRPVTLTILERLHVLSERYVRKHLEPLGRDARAMAEHRAMLDAWLARDEAAITALSFAHIAKTRDDLRLQLNAGAANPPDESVIP